MRKLSSGLKISLCLLRNFVWGHLVHQVDHVPNGLTNSATITTMFPLRLCGGKLLVAGTRKRRYGQLSLAYLLGRLIEYQRRLG